MSSASSQKAPQKAPQKADGQLPACGFTVHGKNGQLPIKVEKRPKGKKVTVISNVQGSAKSLLSALSSLLGCGGSLRQEGQDATLEVQGEQVERVSAALIQLGCLRGIKKEVEAKEKKKTTEVATRVCAYDKFLRKGEPNKSDAKDDAAFVYSTVPCPGAECNLWHGPWIYCRGNCQKVDFDDVWEENLRTDSDQVCKPCRAPTSKVELDAALQMLGMVAEVGDAVANDPSARLAVSNKARAKSRAASRAASRGKEQADAPGSGGAVRGGGRSRSRAPQPRPAPPSARPMQPPPKVGNFACQICGCAFGLQSTLRMHVKNAHPNANITSTKGPALTGLWGPGMSPEVAKVARVWAPNSTSRSRGPSERRSASLAPHEDSSGRTWRSGAGSAAEAYNPVKPVVKTSSSSRVASPRQARSKSQVRIKEPEVCFDPIREAETALALRPRKPSVGAWEHSSHNSSHRKAAHTHRSQSPSRSLLGSSRSTPALEDSSQIYVVMEDYMPTGENQLAVNRGTEVIVNWMQPTNEGGYWAWVTMLPARIKGYMPQKCLAPRHLVHSSSSKSLQAAPVEERSSTSETIPEEWLGSFLELNLDQDQASEFWQNLEDLKAQGLSLENAWLTAINLLNEGPTAPALVASALYEDDEADRASYLASLEALHWLPEGDVQTEFGLILAVSQRWEGQDSVQLTVDVGDRISVKWVQPLAEGGYWIYGSLEGKGQKGYIPRTVLVSGSTEGDSSNSSNRGRIADAEAGSTSRGRIVRRCSSRSVERPKARDQASASYATTPISQAASPISQAASPISQAATSITQTLAAHQASDTLTSLASSVGAAPTETAVAVPCGGRWRKQDRSKATTRAEPEAKIEHVGLAVVGPHVAPAFDSWTAPEKAEDGFWQTASSPVLNSEDELWASKKLHHLSGRFCTEKVAPDVMMSLLTSCRSQMEMQEEAESLFANNIVVKNFVSELWKRRQLCSGEVSARARGR